MKVSELRPDQKKVELLVKVEEITPPRQVVTSADGMFHNVADALVGDETGCIYLSLWDENIQLAAPGKYYKISNAYTAIYKNSMQLSIGKYGKITPGSGDFEINTANNLSLREM